MIPQYSGRSAGPPSSSRRSISNSSGIFCTAINVNRVFDKQQPRPGRYLRHITVNSLEAVTGTAASRRVCRSLLPACSSSAHRTAPAGHLGSLQRSALRDARGIEIADATGSGDTSINPGGDSGGGNRGGAGGRKTQTGQGDDDSNDDTRSNSSSNTGLPVSVVEYLLSTPAGFTLLAATVLLAFVGAMMRQWWSAAEVRGTLQSHQEHLQQLSGNIGVSDASLSLWQSVAAVKRLLREVFADQLGLKQRLEKLETSTAIELEAADDYQLAVLGVESNATSSQGRSAVRTTGSFIATGLLPWSQEPSGADALSHLQAVGASGDLEGRIQLHSVLAGGKRRITAELGPAESSDGTSVLQLHKLLYRVGIGGKLHLLIAPLGGSLTAVARSVTPATGDYGCTRALRRGHGLSMFDSLGSGKAACFVQGNVSAAAGFFVGGTSNTSIAQLQAKTQEGHSFTVLAARNKLRRCRSLDSSHDQPPGMRFLGAQAPGTRIHGKTSRHNEAQTEVHTVGAVGVVPVRDFATANVWAERSTKGVPSWGVGLYSRPDPDGVEFGMMLGRQSSCDADIRCTSRNFCELTAKIPVGEGLSISPGAVVVCGASSSHPTLAYSMQSSWRF